MNRFQKAGLAVIFAAGMVFAQLWTPTAPHGQVAFPWVVDCKGSGNFNEDDENDPCYKEMGGFWWGYLAGYEGPSGAGGDDVGPWKCANAPGQSAKGGQTSKKNKVQVKISGEWTNFVGVDYPECLGPDITNRKDGTSLIGDALEVKLTVGPGYILEPDIYEPSLSGFGVSLVQFEASSTPRDVSDKNGFCMTYSSDHENTRLTTENAGSRLVLTLGWNEGYKPNANLVKGFDSWYAVVPPSNGSKVTQDFVWTGTEKYGDDPSVRNQVGDFYQDNWTNWPSNKNVPPGAPFKIEKATKELTSVKINFSGYEEKEVNFKLYEFGFAGQCGKGGTPIVASGARSVNPVSFNMIGKTLSMNSSAGKPLAVQVINLQGAVVQTKTMSNGDKMSLQNLPTGIYMVRVPALGYTVKQVVK